MFSRHPDANNSGRSLFIRRQCAHPAMIGDINDGSVRPEPLLLEEARGRRVVVAIIDKLAAGFTKLLASFVDILGPKAKMTDAEGFRAAIFFRQLRAAIAKNSDVQRAVA